MRMAYPSSLDDGRGSVRRQRVGGGRGPLVLRVCGRRRQVSRGVGRRGGEGPRVACARVGDMPEGGWRARRWAGGLPMAAPLSFRCLEGTGGA